MYVNVQFRNRKTGEFSGHAYSFVCNIAGIAEGDVVIAPTAYGDSEAKIVAANVPESMIDAHIFPLLKEITQRKEA